MFLTTFISLFLLTTNLPASATAGWFNGDWHYRVRVSVNKAYVNGTLANFPVYVNLAGLNGTSFFSYINSDGSDIVVTKDDGTTRVARELATINTTSKTGELYFQANGASLSNSANGDFYIYYNNPIATEFTVNGTYAKERVWDSNYLGVWHFNSDPSIKTYDSTSNNYDCTAYQGLNGNNLVSGKVNNALLFNGSQSQYINCGITTALQSKAKVSLSAWFKRRNASAQMAMGVATLSSTVGVGIFSPSSANIYSSPYGTSGYGSYASNDTNWHQLHWLFNGSSASGNSGRLQTYLDGSNVSLSYTGTVPATTAGTLNLPFSIGYFYNSSNYYTNGYWDEVRLSTTLRSFDWAKTEYNNLNSPSTFYTLAAIEPSTDLKLPVIYSIYPTDNLSGVRYNTNLTLTFAEAVDTQSGNIYIKKSSDNSTVQTIAANSSSVTGNGTNVLTVNLSDLMSNNGYYVQIDSTAIQDLSGNAYAGINDATTWNFTTETIGTWYNGDWHYRVKVSTIHDSVNGDVTNFPVYVNLASLNGTSFFTNVNSDGSDIRVTKIDGTTQVAREIVSINTTSKTGEFYFVANGTLSGTYNGSYYIYYNNPLATEPTANGTYAKEKVWSTGYLGVWHFASDPAVKTYDSTSNNYDCTAYLGLNGNNLVAGKVNYALLFNGAQSQYMDCGNMASGLTSKAKVSLSAWFKRRNTSSPMGLGAAQLSAAAGVGIYSPSSAAINSAPYGGSTGMGSYTSNDTNWHQLHWLFNGSAAAGNTNRLKTYFDGSNVSLTYTGTAPTATASSLNLGFTIGYFYNVGTNYYSNGYWDEIRLSTVTRSNNWAKAEYNNLNSPSTFYSLSVEAYNDSKAPTLVTLDPADNATAARYNTNLTMTFAEAIDTQTGNIIVKKSSDNSIVQTIAANSSAVTGNGTHIITVNLNDLMANNGYYVQIQSTAFKDLAGNIYAGINDTTSWNFTTQNVGAWYNGDWHYRVKVNTIHNYVNGDLTNFPVYVNLALLNGTSFFTNVNSDGSDIRVTKIDGTTQVAREIVSINTTSKTGELYFQANGTLSSIYNGSYYIYYNNPLATEPTANGTYAKEKVWDSNYIGVWHFASDPSLSTYDSTSNNYDCTAYGGLNGNNLVAGKVGYALIFNGTQSQYVNCGIGVALQSKTKLGLSGWFKRRNASSNIALGASGNMGNYGVGIYSPGSANINSAAYAPQAYGAYASNDTNWHQVHWLYNGSLMGNSNRLRTYFDGSNVSLTYTGTAPTATFSTFTNAFSIGTLYVNPSLYYTNGYWDEVRLSSIARSNNWIKTEYNNLNSPATFMGLAVETVTDTKLPLPISITPADNSTNVRYNTNLTINFIEFVDTQSGNIYIKKSSDNSTVQTIRANSVSVTGNGTTTLTIDINDLASNNGYYVQIDNNAIQDLFGNYYTGINDTTTWSFTSQGLNNWFNGDWHYRIKVTTNTNYVNGDLSNYPFYVDLSSFNGTNFFTALNANGSDIRVTKIDGTTQVAREVSFVNRTTEIGELYFVANGTLSKTYGDSFYIYYGNPLATEPTANGTYAKERVWDSDYIGVWHLSQGGYFDSTSNNYDCTAGGGINGNNLVTGRVGQAVLFNGTQSQYLGCGVYTAINNKTKLSMSSWLKRRVASANVSAAARGGGSNDLGLYANTAGNISINLNTNTSPPYFASNDTNWHSVQWLFNGTQATNSTRIRVYYDGSLQALTFPATVATTSSTYQSAWAFSIGSSGSLNNYTNGYWDEMRLSSATRTPNWVKTEYNNLSSPSTFYSFTAAEQYSADVTAPAIVSLSPADNATNARINANLVLNFNDLVDTQTSTNLYVKKSSDNSTVQTISMTSSAVTGNGTSSLTVDINDLMSNNGYYIQIDNNAIKDLAGNAYAGINDTSTWNFTTRTTGNWFNGSWLYRTQIITNNAKVNGSSLTNFPIYVDLAHLSSINMFNLTKSDGSDIRITKDDGITQVAREIAYFNATTNAGEMYFVANGTLSGTEDETFYIYYGNAAATEPTANGTYAKEKVWDTGYLGVWHFTTDPSVNTYDSTSNNYDCSQTGSMTSADLVSGKVNYALNFDGTNDYVSCGITSALQNKTLVSLSGWLKRRAVSGSMVLGASNNSGSAGVGIIAYSSLTYFAPYGQYNSASVARNDVSWHHVSWAFDGSKTGDAARLKTYMDGFHQYPTYSTIPAATYNSTFNYPFRIGYIYDSNLGGNMFANGYWDEVRLSNVVRSSDWVKTEYNNLNSPSTFYSIGAVNKVGNPGVASFSPVDNGMYVAIDTNLVINFDEAVTLQSGNIYIKKSSDDSTVETISVGGPRVALSNFNQTVTIDPTGNFTNNNGYYVQIDANAFKDSTLNGYLGIADTSTWNFTTVPIVASDWLQGGVWDKRLKIEINKSQINGSVANFPVYVSLASLPATFFDDVANNGIDVRVTKSDGVTQVASEVVWLNKTQNAGELHFIANGTLTNSANGVYYLYYKNAYATAPAANSSYGKYNLWTRAGYAAVWHLSESPTGTIYNSASGSYNCTSYGSMLNSNKAVGYLVGNGTSFDGTNDYLDCGDITQLNGTSKFSLSSWTKKSTAGVSLIYGAKYYNANNHISSMSYTSGNFYHYVNNAGSNYASVSALNDTAWHHVVMAFNGNLSGNSSRLVIYNNGSVYSVSYGGTIPATTADLTGYNFWIGKDSVYNAFSNGTHDEVRVSSVMRDGSWVRTEYRNQNSPSTFYSVSSVNLYTSLVLLSLSPYDGSTSAGADENLIMTFDRKIDLQYGNIYIKKSSDNSIVETISVSSGLVTGNGTSQITINPANDLARGNGYYVQVDATALDDTGGNSYAGINDTTTWNFATSYWYSGSWLNRIKITVNSAFVNGSVSNFPVYLKMSDLPAAFYDNVANNGADLRVTKGNGLTEVAREVVWLNKTQNAGELYFVANGAMTNAANTAFYIYYKNPYVTEPSASATYGKYNTWAASGYVGVWHLNESPASSATLYNSASSSYNCTSYGSMVAGNRIAGQLAGNGTSFDGSNDYLNCGDITQLNSTTKFTITGWMKRTSAGNFMSIFNKYASASSVISADFYSTTFYGLLMNSTGSTATATNNDTSWHHIATIFNGNLSGNANRYNAYNNGTLMSLSFSGTIPASAPNLSATPVYIGRDDYAGPYGNGRADEVRVVNLARTGSWIKTEYNNQNSPSTFYSVSAIESIPDIQAPSALTFSPADNFTGAAASANLVITFDEPVDTQAGNIYIKKSSDDSTVETILANSGSVSGNGTTQITIDPSGSFAFNTGYYVQIASGAIKDTAGNSYAGIADTSTWNFSTSGWYSDNWTKRIPITINATYINGSVTNFPVFINLNGMPASFTNDVLANGADLRVTKSDGSTEVAREVVFLNRTANAGELHFVANGTMTNSANSTFYIYYKNATATEPSASASYGKYNVWAPYGYVGVWHLNENPTGTLYNSASASYNCTSAGSMLASNRVAAAGGLAGNGTSFDGSNDYLDCGDVNELDSVSKFTITGWAKRTSSGSHVILGAKFTNASARIESWYYSDGNYYNIVGTGTYGYGAKNDTNWHHTAMIYNGNLSTNATRAVTYIDAAPLTHTYSGTIPATSSNHSGNFFMSRSAAGNYTNGRLDEIRVSSVARTPNWLKTEYNNQNSPNTFYTIGSVDIMVDTTAPTVSSFSPTDNSTGISISTDLIITFNEAVDTQVGNIYIKKSSDDTTVQTIVASSGLVSGNGTTQLTINPSDLAYNTSYYVQIQNTAIKDTSANAYAGISNTTTWNFTTIPQAPSDWLSGSLYRVQMIIDKSLINGSVARFPVYVDLNGMSSHFFTNINNNGTDLRVTKDDGVTQVAREVVRVNKSATTGELHFLANGTLSNSSNGTFYLYYGNPSATEPSASSQYGKYAVWNGSTGYAAVYHFQEDPSGTIYNSAASTYNCTSSGGMTASLNKVVSSFAAGSNGYSFDGTNDYLDCGDVNELDSVTKYTVTGWAKRTSAGSHVVIADKYTDANNRMQSWYYSDGNYYGITSSAGAAFGYITKNDTSWHHTVMIFNGNLSTNANRMKVYFDGALSGSLTFTGTIPASSANHSGNMNIGRANAATYTNGRIDEVRISRLARNGSWIKTEYNNQSAPNSFTSFTNYSDLVSPAALSYSPADGSTGISASANLVMTFERNIDIQTGNIYIKKLSDNSTVQTIAVNSVALTGNGTTQITINPPSDLADLTAYYINIDATAFDDTAGNSYAGMTGNGTWNFTTMGDVLAPTISSFSPADNATVVPVASNLVMNFSEAVNVQTGNFVIYNSGGSIFETIDIAGGLVTGTGTSTITVNPTSNLADYSTYYVLINSGVIKDLAGNSYAGISANTTWNFTTDDLHAPTIMNYSPPHTSILQQRYAGLRIVFNEAVQKGAGTIVIKQVSDDTTVASVNVSSPTVAVNGNQLYVQMPDKLPEGTEFYIQLSPGVVKDLSDNDYAGISNTSTWRFSTSASENSLFL